MKIKKFESWLPVFYHGDKRMKLGNKNDMLIWYRRDLSTVLITQKAYEKPACSDEYGVEFTHVPRKKRKYLEFKTGLLMFVGKPTEYNIDNPENYFITIGEGWGMTWVNERTRPLTFLIPDDQPLYCYWTYGEM